MEVATRMVVSSQFCMLAGSIYNACRLLLAGILMLVYFFEYLVKCRLAQVRLPGESNQLAQIVRMKTASQ